DSVRRKTRRQEAIGRGHGGDKRRVHRVGHFRDRRQGSRSARQGSVIEEEREESRNQRNAEKGKYISGVVMAEASHSVLDEHNKEEDRNRQREAQRRRHRAAG